LNDSLLGILFVITGQSPKGIAWIDREDDPSSPVELCFYLGVPTWTMNSCDASYQCEPWEVTVAS